MKTLNSSLAFESSDVAKFRFHVLEYYYKWGLKPTLDAFRVKKSTLYDWKNLHEKSRKRLASLVPKSTRPHNTRKMLTDGRLVEFIKQIRQKSEIQDQILLNLSLMSMLQKKVLELFLNLLLKK